MANLDDSLKAPVVYLYNEAEELLASTLELNELGIVDFLYKYDDEEEDTCTFKIQASSKAALDNLNIRRNSKLKFKWGYLNGPLSPIVTVMVKDLDSKYGLNALYVEYECSDLTSYLKLVRSVDISKGTLIGYISSYVTLTSNVVIQSGTEVIYKQSHHNPATPRVRFFDVNVSPNPAVFNPLNRVAKGEGFLNREETVDPIGGTWFVEPEHKVRAYFELERDIVSTNRSSHTVIAEYLNTCPYGPWFVTGRGNTLLIHNRNLGNEVYKSYYYQDEPSDLIDFSAKTNYEDFEKQTISSVNIDPVNKSLKDLEAYVSKLENLRSFKDVFTNTSISKEERLKLLKELVYINRNEYERFRASVTVNVQYEITKTVLPVIGSVDEVGNPIMKPYTVTDVIQLPVGDRQENSPFLKKLGEIKVYTLPFESPEDAQSEQENTLRKLEQESEEGTFILEGDPYLMSEFVVYIGNVQSIHEGKYYVKKCEHEISESGYKTTLETLKVKNTSAIKLLQNEIEAEEDSIENEIMLKTKEIFLKQQEVFKQWSITGSTPHLLHSGIIGDMSDYGTNVDLNAILENRNLNSDQAYEQLAPYVQDGSLDLQVRERDIYSPENR